MNDIVKIGTCTGIVIYHYNFTNKNGVKIDTYKILFNLNNMPVFVVSNKIGDKKVGDKVVLDIGYNGTKFVLV